MKVYSIRDVVAGTYDGLYMFPNDAVACRWFGLGCQRGTMKEVRKDMMLFRIGAFDQETGVIDVENPTLIMKGSDVSVSDEV